MDKTFTYRGWKVQRIIKFQFAATPPEPGSPIVSEWHDSEVGALLDVEDGIDRAVLTPQELALLRASEAFLAAALESD